MSVSRIDVVLAGHLADGHSLAIVTEGVSSEDAPTRASAYGALARLEALTNSLLLRALTDSSNVVIRRAITLAAATDRDEWSIDQRLIELVNGTDHDLAEAAAWSLGERWQEQSNQANAALVLDALEHATISHTDALVREAAVAALGAIGADRSISSILQATQDKATVRRRAVIALAPFDGPEVHAALNTASEDRDWQVRQAAEDLLREEPEGS